MASRSQRLTESPFIRRKLAQRAHAEALAAEKRQEVGNKQVSYYGMLTGSWNTTKFELDRQLLTLSVAGIGVPLAIVLNVKVITPTLAVLYGAAMVLFAITAWCELTIFKKNAEHIEDQVMDLENKRPIKRIDDWFDRRLKNVGVHVGWRPSDDTGAGRAIASTNGWWKHRLHRIGKCWRRAVTGCPGEAVTALAMLDWMAVWCFRLGVFVALIIAAITFYSMPSPSIASTPVNVPTVVNVLQSRSSILPSALPPARAPAPISTPTMVQRPPHHRTKGDHQRCPLSPQVHPLQSQTSETNRPPVSGSSGT